MSKKVKIQTPETAIAEIGKELAEITKSSEKIITIKSQETYEEASLFLSSTLKPRINKIKETSNFFTEPYVEQRRVALENKNRVEGLFNQTLKPLLDLELSIRKSMSTYLREAEEIARKEEEKLLEKREKQDAKREAKGLDPIATPVPTIERPVATVKNDSGGKTTAKKVWKFEIVDYDNLPEVVTTMVFQLAKEKGLVDAIVRDLVKNGERKMEGVRIYEDFDISTRA